MIRTIYIDGLFYKGAGIGRYYETLVKELAKEGLQIYTCVPEELKDVFEKDFKEVRQNLNPIFVNYKKFSIQGFLKQSFILLKLKRVVELFFFPHVNLPAYVPQNTIVTIHDLRPLTKFWDRGELKRKIFLFYLKRALKKAKGIITISHTVAQELDRRFNVKNKVEVIYNFVNDKFTENGCNCKNEAHPLINDNYILYVGARKRHKNLENLILAFYEIKDRAKVKLVIAGAKDNKSVEDEIDQLIRTLNLRGKVIEILSPTDEILINLYRNARLFVFPSFFEGFGMPPLEAISLNCPAITSNIPVLREILGEKIACLDPYDISDMATKIQRALIDEKFRKELLTEGKLALQKCDRNRIINQYLDYFTFVLQNMGNIKDSETQQNLQKIKVKTGTGGEV